MSTDGDIQGAVTLLERGRLAEARTYCESLLRVQPRHFDALCLLCFIATQLQDLAAALRYINRALQIDDTNALAHFNQATVLHALKDLPGALESYRRTIEMQPQFAEAHSNMSAIELQVGRPQDALQSAARAIEINATLPEGYFNRANAYRAQSRWLEALADYDKAIALRPRYPEAYINRGLVYATLHRWSEASVNFVAALAIKPNDVNALLNLGNVRKEMQQWQEALRIYDRALSIDVQSGELHANRGSVLRQMGEYSQALASFAKAHELTPELPWVFGQMLHEKLRVVDWGGLTDEIARLAALISQGRRAATPFVALGCLDSPALQRKAAEIYAESQCPRSTISGTSRRPKCEGRATIGYFSADFQSHATAYLIADLLEIHDRSRFRVVGFSFGAKSADAMRLRLEEACDEFIDVRDRSDQEIVDLARQMKVDIAVDLKGYTTDARPGVFAQRALPLQVSYLGYPGTMGTPYMDYLIADSTVVPREEMGHYSEKLCQLPGCYQPNDRKRLISQRQFTRSELGLPNDGVVFCCFNNSWKILPDTFGCWMQILRGVPNSVLWLLEDNRWARSNLQEQARRQGVESSRLVFAQREALPDHLARHRCADLFLDSWPCNAHTTASDALWAGLPLLANPGRSFAARVSASLLAAVGLPQMVATGPRDYVEMAIELARHPARLAAVRQHLESNRDTLDLFNTPLYARHLEAGYSAMLERAAKGLPPDHIVVAA